jgi:hypothetical protein
MFKTSFEITEYMVDQISYISGDILVLNIEFAIYFIEHMNINPSRITFLYDNNIKLAAAAKLGVYKFIDYQNFKGEEHIYIYNSKTGEKIINMKFDVIVGNPPYNKGLLSKKRTEPICNTDNETINAASKIRIDAAFIVIAYEKLLKEGGISVFVWPYVWTQLPNWINFRVWIKNSGLEFIHAIQHQFNNIKSNTAITFQKKGYSGPAYYNNIYRNYNDVIDFSYDIIPNCYGYLGKEIFKKEMSFKHKLNYISFKEWKKNKNKYPYYVMHSTATGTSNISGAISSNISQLPRCEYPANVIKSDDFADKNKTDSIPVIIFDSKEHKQRYIKYFNSSLFNFILHQRKADFHNTKNNLGLMPDVCKNMNGVYTDKKAYDILGLTKEEVEVIEKTVGLPVIE